MATLAAAALGGCTLWREGGIDCPEIDPAFYGCFERSEQPADQIIIGKGLSDEIIDESDYPVIRFGRCGILRGSGFGIYPTASGARQGWAFSGTPHNGSARSALLSITLENGDRTNATADLTPAGDGLEFRDTSRPDIRYTLRRCVLGGERR